MEHEPQPTGGFEWTQARWGLALGCRPLAGVAHHFFSTRHLPLRKKDDGDHPAGWEEAALAMGVDASRLVRMKQMHGAAVFVAVAAAPRERPAGDIAVTQDPELALSVQVADCVPLLIADRRTHAVCAAHAGWRGTVQHVAARAVEAMRVQFGSAPGDLIAAVGPSIGPCCYAVGDDVLEAFESAGHDASDLARWFTRGGPDHKGSTRCLDLWTSTADQLIAAGVPAVQVHTARLCTAAWPEWFHSYRRDGVGVGRQLGVIRARSAVR